jgi:hypothetical protein
LDKVTLNKTISARKLSRTGVPTPEPEATIPFGAILDRVERDRDMARFRYLTEMYQCPFDMFASAVDDGALEPTQPEPADGKKRSLAPPAAAVPHLEFEKLLCNGGRAGRAKVPGGWLVWVEPGGVAFVPDPEHKWQALVVDADKPRQS